MCTKHFSINIFTTAFAKNKLSFLEQNLTSLASSIEGLLRVFLAFHIKYIRFDALGLF